MELRRKIFPKTLGDSCGIFFLLFMFPVCYWFEVFVVLPNYYEDSPVLYTAHCIFSTILLFNVVGNFVAVCLIDTSTQRKIIPSTLKPSWKFCSVCESITPPRSWHCNVCQSCILKRDHHCNFTACCIGHNNQRYFIAFLFYLSLSTIYCTYFNAYYLWKITTLSSVYSILKLMLPLAVLLSGNDTTILQVYRVICIISIVGMFAAVSLFVYHLMNVMKGVTMYEKSKKILDYDLGSATENIKLALGDRWYLTLISPFVKSELLHDGINWDQMKLFHGKSK